jgi:glucose/arabinose dehydrogenase
VLVVVSEMLEMRLHHRLFACLAPAVLAAALAGPAAAQAPSGQRVESSAGPIQVETVARGLENPWGLAFLPDGRMLVTERPGRLRIVSATGQLSQPLGGLPRIAARGQGGLLDVALDPNFGENRMVYLSFAAPGEGGGAATAVARGRLNAASTALEGTNVIFQQQPAGNTGRHFGSRLVFGRDGNLFVTTGDRGNMEMRAQDPAGHIGKVLRLRPDGSVPADNPFVNQAGTRPEIWSSGHRNAQGAALHPQSGALWTIEHGARGGDEINIVRKGLNYGWPVITYGVDYSGARIGEGQARPGLEQPIHYWDPSIAPSGAVFYTGNRYRGWTGSLFTGGLASQMLLRISVDGEKVMSQERLLQGLNERIRDVRQGPDGLLYLLTDNSDGRVLRLRPAS